MSKNLVTIMDKAAGQMQKVLVCWQETGDTVNHFKIFDTHTEAEVYFEQTLKPASDMSYKFYAY